ncbi:hypothetical protein DL93DRAFT_2077329 [Clavulina sp. PMI_390]|nr:hypothetical protein DL93DRAFT_2077329 [Clavulina sp. PMI_390]
MCTRMCTHTRTLIRNTRSTSIHIPSTNTNTNTHRTSISSTSTSNMSTHTNTSNSNWAVRLIPIRTRILLIPNNVLILAKTIHPRSPYSSSTRSMAHPLVLAQGIANQRFASSKGMDLREI